jgi:sugar phosphate isomerase/epimerase
LFPTINVCTAVLPAASFEDVVEIARASGYQGVELRVDAQYHKSLEDLWREGMHIQHVLEKARLKLPILSSYIPLDDQRSVDKLLHCCQNMGVPKARLVLPRSCQAAVVRQAQAKAIIPSYNAGQEPRALLASVRKTLRRLERQAAAAGVQLLLELHWGTVMSSFSSAYWLVHDLDPACIAITFDPANMLVEGKEDWEFGIKLIQPHLANVHVKNMRWSANHTGWVWAWAPLTQGMVDWPDLIGLLKRNHYAGDYAIEDFLAPNTSKVAALAYLTRARSQFCQLYEQASAVDAIAWHGEPNMIQVWRQPDRVTPTMETSLTINADTTLEGRHVEISSIG